MYERKELTLHVAKILQDTFKYPQINVQLIDLADVLVTGYFEEKGEDQIRTILKVLDVDNTMNDLTNDELIKSIQGIISRRTSYH